MTSCTGLCRRGAIGDCELHVSYFLYLLVLRTAIAVLRGIFLSSGQVSRICFELCVAWSSKGLGIRKVDVPDKPSN